MIIIAIAVALMLTYLIFWKGWHFSFTKGQMLVVFLVLILTGAFLHSFIKDDDDAFLLGFALILVMIFFAFVTRPRRMGQ